MYISFLDRRVYHEELQKEQLQREREEKERKEKEAEERRAKEEAEIRQYTARTKSLVKDARTIQQATPLDVGEAVSSLINLHVDSLSKYFYLLPITTTYRYQIITTFIISFNYLLPITTTYRYQILAMLSFI